MECSLEMRAKLSQKFSVDASFAEDALDRVQHVAKQVWSLVNMLAFSNLFRFADPRQPMGLPNPEDSIFIPYIPTARHEAARHEAARHEEEQTQTQTPPVVKFDPARHVCNDCGKMFNPMNQHKIILPETGATEFYLCHSCGFKRDFPDEYRFGFPDDEQTHFNEIAEMLVDGKITPEQASTLFEELSVDPSSFDPSQQPLMEPEAVVESSESDKDDESNATYWLRTVAAWNAAERIKNEKK
jgi:RNase P subunit RPR2